MKLFHLSDLHIGKRVHEFSMIEDQKYMLTQILQAVMREKPDGVLISGDVYDRTIPTAEAVQVLDAFLTSLSEQEVPVFIISGNHDSAARLNCFRSILSRQNVYMIGTPPTTEEEHIEKVTLQDAYGDLHFYLLPFVKMSDYIMAVSITGLTASVLLFYYWLKSRKTDAGTAFILSLMFLLAGPMIGQYSGQIMFVDYMPSLCLALIGVDRYFEQEKSGLFTISVFLMIMSTARIIERTKHNPSRKKLQTVTLFPSLCSK